MYMSGRVGLAKRAQTALDRMFKAAEVITAKHSSRAIVQTQQSASGSGAYEWLDQNPWQLGALPIATQQDMELIRDDVATDLWSSWDTIFCGRSASASYLGRASFSFLNIGHQPSRDNNAQSLKLGPPCLCVQCYRLI